MVKVLIIERNLSERVLIQSLLPDHCVHFIAPAFFEAAEMLEHSSTDVIVAGPSVGRDEYLKLTETVGKYKNTWLFIILSRTSGDRVQAEHVFKILLHTDGLFSIVPPAPDFIKNSIEDLVRERLRSIPGRRDNYLYDKMSVLVGESELMSGLKSDVVRLSTAPGPVLITGESGTGKEIVARLVHDFSFRKEQLYYALNAGAIPLGLSESELFGSETGAYTGAVRRKGCFEHADGGTLFLDEIGEIEKHIQVEFLRVLETGCIRRIGGNRQIKIDVRLIAATNRNLAEAVSTGQFRQDLLFRINMFQIKIPPLREHKEDIPDLIGHFSSQLKQQRPDKYYTFSDSFIDGLFDHSWPGNIRELRNVFHRAVYASDSEVLTSDSLQFDSFASD
jgi:DNA-binding NtrC family response regulator